ncbi:MAG TPA: universal stress protein [Burkholderiales bacterium]|nr:universal stress protein [Burkholderiales bacterium]
MYRRILVPVDGSATATLGLRHAVDLAKALGAQIRLLTVVDELVIPSVDAYAPVDLANRIAILKEGGKKVLDAAAAFVAENAVESEEALVETHGEHVSSAILRDAKEWGADLIVMGTHGRRGLTRLLLGSDAERVLRDAPAPVLLVRTDDAKRSL